MKKVVKKYYYKEVKGSNGLVELMAKCYKKNIFGGITDITHEPLTNDLKVVGVDHFFYRLSTHRWVKKKEAETIIKTLNSKL